ncbi:hypothetical protein [uncultured Sphingomonas sp.]|uniref:hypothetical protein n=1 Tax=uncultured Sphingomonas sp. TaxID=158754 RepID=UPI0035C9FC2F
MHVRIRTISALMFIWLTITALPAAARIRIVFWSQEFGQNFPHAFVTLDGRLDRGGMPVSTSFGFTAKTLSPGILMGTVAGKIDYTSKGYLMKSFAHFTTTISDAQYDSIMKLPDEWGDRGDHRYNLNKRNCVHFVAEAAKRAGLTVAEPAGLMKRPHAFLESLVPLNTGRLTPLEMSAKDFYSARGMAATSAR